MDDERVNPRLTTRARLPASRIYGVSVECVVLCSLETGEAPPKTWMVPLLQSLEIVN